MKQANIISKIGIVISLASLFLLATYFGKAVRYIDDLLFIFGLLLGMAIFEADEFFLFKYYAKTETNVANHKQATLVTRSLLFMLLLFPLGLFLLTSTGSAIGVGIFLSIIYGLSLELFSFRNDKHSFKERFLYQLKRDITIEEQKAFIAVFISMTVLYSFFVIFLGR